jgi:hypothetical protein
VLGDVLLGELPMLFLPLEQDLLSLELETAFQELYFVYQTWIKLMHQSGDLSSISSSAQALMQLQSTYGLFPRLTGKGDKAKTLADMLLRMRQESIIDSRTALYGVGQSQSIESLIIIDREVDFITPLLTQLTYEGLIDEKYRIKNSENPLSRSKGSLGGTRYQSDLSGDKHPFSVLICYTTNRAAAYTQTGTQFIGPLVCKLARCQFRCRWHGT